MGNVFNNALQGDIVKTTIPHVRTWFVLSLALIDVTCQHLLLVSVALATQLFDGSIGRQA